MPNQNVRVRPSVPIRRWTEGLYAWVPTIAIIAVGGFAIATSAYVVRELATVNSAASLWDHGILVMAASLTGGFHADQFGLVETAVDRRVEALDSLNRVAELLVERPDDHDAAIDLLLQRVPDALGFSVAVLQFCVDGGRGWAPAKVIGLNEGLLHPHALELPLWPPASKFRMVVAPDLEGSDSPVDLPYARQAGVRAAVVVPIASGDELIGVLTLGAFASHAFTTEQIASARLWATQIGLHLVSLRSKEILARRHASGLESLLENARLNEQAGRDSANRVTLLRELHHRVKNNLAAIVGLISTNVPTMTPAAREWLDRLTERISAMAQAQELFSRPTTDVPLSDVVQRVVDSIAPLAPPGVRVVIDLGAKPARLDPARAVALMMALHELCHNALTYGVSERGTLTLRACETEPGWMRIEVVDQGNATGNAGGDLRASRSELADVAPDDVPSGTVGVAGAFDVAIDATPTARGPRSPMEIGRAKLGGKGGVGIHVVRGLVARELRGLFSLLSPPHGGTIAVVEFPLADDPHEQAPAANATMNDALSIDTRSNDNPSGDAGSKATYSEVTP